jgi:hypothetical protein
MSKFKLAKKDALSCSRTNLQELHESKLEYFEEEKRKLPELYKLLSETPKTNVSLIRELENKIYEIENDIEYNNYLLDFFSIINGVSNEYLENTQKGNLDTFVNSKINTSKTQIYNQYIDTFDVKIDKIDIPDDTPKTLCKLCNGCSIVYEQSSNTLICMDCGLSTMDICNNIKKPDYTEEIEEVVVFNYRRDNHFQECLNQLQAKENTTIPRQIISDLNKEFRKYNITNPKMITIKLVRDYLKKLGYSKYYEHVPTIINEFCGLPAPKLTAELEQQLRIMFDEIQQPFMKWKNIIDPERKNFLNYNYTFYKMLQLLNKDEFLGFFTLLKSRIVLYKHDMIWKGICKDLQWQFIPSI